MKDDVRKLWETVDRVSLTVDAWTAENGTGLLGITVHWVDDKWAYREWVLAIREIVGKHDGENMATIVIQALDEFGLRSKRMMALMARKKKIGNPKFTARRHVPCVVHILNIVVQAAIKNFGVPSAQVVEPNQGDLTRTAEHYDIDQDNNLGDICSASDDYDGGRQPLCLADAVAKVRTLVRNIRSSTQRREIYRKACEDDPEVEDCNMVVLDCPTRWNSTYAMLASAVKKWDMSKDEWELVKEFCRILGRFAVTTDHVCKTVTPAMRDVLFLIDSLKTHMEKETDRATKAEACKAMHRKLAQYAEILWANKAITTAALMDPFHKGTMLQPGVREATIAYVWREAFPLSCCRYKGAALRLFDKRTFSVGTAIVTYKRSRLSPISIETLITVKSWLRADNKRWYSDVDLESDANEDEDGVLACARAFTTQVTTR
ncbi:putative transcriptional regulator tpeD [Wolffia australiana]